MFLVCIQMMTLPLSTVSGWYKETILERLVLERWNWNVFHFSLEQNVDQKKLTKADAKLKQKQEKRALKELVQPTKELVLVTLYLMEIL